MDILSRVFSCILYSSLTGSIIVLIVCFIKKALNKHIGIRLHHALWVLVLLRLLIPVVPESPVSVFNLFTIKSLKLLPAENKNTIPNMAPYAYGFLNQRHSYWNSREIIDYLEYIKDNQRSQSASIKVPYPKRPADNQGKEKGNFNQWIFQIASGVWFAGVALMILSALLGKIYLHRKFKHCSKPAGQDIVSLAEACRKRIKVKKHIPVYIGEIFKSPCITGIINPRICLPQGINTHIADSQLSHVLLHELSHYKRKDMIFNMLGVIAAILHWFNPIVWFSVKRMKLDRELACDAHVLEVLGEEEAMPYGMTIISFSKLFLGSEKRLSLANFFQTKKQLRRRIDMINMFHRNSYKISAAAIIGCIILGVITLTNAVSPKTAVVEDRGIQEREGGKAAVPNSIVAEEISTTEPATEFLIDAPVKYYQDLERVKELAGFKFKIPDFIPSIYKVDGFRLIKSSNKAHMVDICFGTDRNKGEWKNFSFYASEEKPVILLTELAKSKLPGSAKEGDEASSTEAMNIGGINGLNTIIRIKRNNYEFTKKFFVWQDEGVWYGIKYTDMITSLSGKVRSMTDIPLEEIKSIVLSILYPQEIQNANYNVPPIQSTEVGQLSIYDRQDLKKAQELIGFTPKFPLNPYKGIKIESANTIIGSDSDMESNKIQYDFYIFYEQNNGRLIFSQRKSSKDYKEFEQQGYKEIHYYDSKERSDKIKRIDAKSLNVGSTQVFMYESKYRSDDPECINYVWKEDGFYCLATFYGEIENQEEILRELINEKPIE